MPGFIQMDTVDHKVLSLNWKIISCSHYVIFHFLTKWL